MTHEATSRDAQIIQKLASYSAPVDHAEDPDIAPLFPGFGFADRLVAGLTPIERDGPLDFVIDRPGGLGGWILNITVKGSGRVFRGAKAFDVEPGDLLLFPPRVVHYYGRAADADCWWHRWIYFQPRPHWTEWLNWREEVGGVFVLRRQESELYATQNQLFSEIAAWPPGMDKLSVELSMNSLERLILLCMRQDYAKRNLAIYDERMGLACQFIINHLHLPITVTEVAQALHMSPSRLSHLFSQKFGCGVIRWRDKQRIQLACQSLQMTETPVKIIAARIGYEDPLYFARIFHGHTGMSPTGFREHHRGGSGHAGSAG